MTFDHIAFLAAVPFIAILYVKFVMWLDDRAMKEPRDLFPADTLKRNHMENHVLDAAPSALELSSRRAKPE